MAQRKERARIQRGALTAEEAEKLFATVDETGHTNEETARMQRKRRKEVGQAVDVDPLSDADPSGSNVEKVITKTAVSFVVIFLAIVVVSQVSCGLARRASTANLAAATNVTNVASALRGGVEWGNGFTQFPEDFTVQEADENTHRVEVTVTDTSSKDALEAFAGSQIQATALAVNSLLNPNINTVIYHVNVHVANDGTYENAKLFGFLKPTSEVKTIMTFIWTKTTSDQGVRFNCTITGVDEDMQERLRENITSSFTPNAILSALSGDEKSKDSKDGAAAGSTAAGAATAPNGTTTASGDAAATTDANANANGDANANGSNNANGASGQQ